MEWGWRDRGWGWGGADSSTSSRAHSLISLMCGINIILSDIPELLVLRVATAMIQKCQTGWEHPSNSTHHHHRALHCRYQAWRSPRCYSCFFFFFIIPLQQSLQLFTAWLSNRFFFSMSLHCKLAGETPTSITAQWWIRNRGREYQPYHILSTPAGGSVCRWEEMGSLHPIWGEVTQSLHVGYPVTPAVMTSRLQVVQLSCVSDGTP